MYARIDWIEKLRHWLQTMAFCLTVAGILYAFFPEQAFEHNLVYSLCIGTSCWLLIDCGRHFFASAHETGWPGRAASVVLLLGGNILGFLVGSTVASLLLGHPIGGHRGPNQLFLSLLVSAVAGTVITYYFYSSVKSRYLETQVAQTQAQASQAKLKLLQTQLDPHLLFNTLANLRALITLDPLAALQMLDRMDAYLRATLSASRATEHPLADEFARLEDYLELMKIRMGERLHYRLELPPELAHIAVPSLILQPLVENCIKHGLEPKVQGGEVCVQARWDNGRLHLRVADTGVGMRTDTALATMNENGFGLAQLGERLRTRFGNDVLITCSANQPEGTSVDMVFSVSA